MHVTIRRPDADDAAAMARVHVRCWQETYRGLMPDAMVDDPSLVAQRTRFWADALAAGGSPRRVAVAEVDDELVGVALSGPPGEATGPWARQLFVLYVVAAAHGTGAGAALLDAVVDAEEATVLWVAEQNARALAFYRKNGFVADGEEQVEHGLRAVRMIRAG